MRARCEVGFVEKDRVGCLTLCDKKRRHAPLRHARVVVRVVVIVIVIVYGGLALAERLPRHPVGAEGLRVDERDDARDVDSARTQVLTHDFGVGDPREFDNDVVERLAAILA